MNDETTKPVIGLDVGTSRIVLARAKGSEYEFASQLNAFVSVPYSKMTEKALSKKGIPHTRNNGELMVHGTESQKFADLLGLETRRPMTAGILNSSEPEGADVIHKIVDSLLGDEAHDGNLLFFSMPAAPLEGEVDLTYHEASLAEMFTKEGYKVRSINEALSVVYAELEESNYTGIGVSCGGGLCNVCLSYLAVPVISFSVAKAGDFIDVHAASATGDRPTRVRIEKETSFQLNGAFSDNLHQALGIYYDDMIREVVDAMRREFARSRSLPKFKEPIPLVLSGGTALPKGFAERFERVLVEAGDFPVPLSEVRLAKDPLDATAKGALVAALTEL